MLEITRNGLGFDFYVFWNIGKAVLEGFSPYTISESFYPPITSYLFTVYALFPISLSFILWTIVNSALFIKLTGFSFKKPSRILWFLFWPIAHCFAGGQNSLLFAALIPLLGNEKRWKSVIAATLITLKPQIAVVVLPWFIVRWLYNDRKRIYGFVVSSLAIHLFPLLIRPSIYYEWIQTMSSGAGHKPLMSAGIWLGSEVIPLWALLVVTVVALSLVFHHSEKLSRSALTLVMPALSYYDPVYLIEIAPMSLLVPASIISTLLAHWTRSFLPFCIIAITAYLYRVYKIAVPRFNLARA